MQRYLACHLNWPMPARSLLYSLRLATDCPDSLPRWLPTAECMSSCPHPSPLLPCCSAPDEEFGFLKEQGFKGDALLGKVSALVGLLSAKLVSQPGVQRAVACFVSSRLGLWGLLSAKLVSPPGVN